MLTSPRKSVRGFRMRQGWPGQVVAAVSAGLAVLPPLAWVYLDAYGTGTPSKAFILSCTILGPLLGVAYLYLFGWAYADTCRFLKGNHTRCDVRWAIALSLTPISLFAGPFSLLVLAGAALLPSASLGADSILVIPVGLYCLAMLVAYPWSFFALLKCLSEVCGISIWAAWGATIFARGLVAISLLFPVLLVGGVYVAFVSSP